MKLLLTRHGNTFAPGDPVVWAGAINDIPLVEKGRTQALDLVEALNSLEWYPARICTGSLLRTKEYAELVKDGLKVGPAEIEIVSCLHEVDYGRWTGLTTEEVIRLGDGAEQEAWNNESIWPDQIFNGDPERLQSDICSFASGLVSEMKEDDLVLAVTSNGVLRYFLNLIDGGLKEAVEQQQFKVATGNICLLEWNHNKWKKKLWNLQPDQIRTLLQDL